MLNWIQCLDNLRRPLPVGPGLNNRGGDFDIWNVTDAGFEYAVRQLKKEEDHVITH